MIRILFVLSALLLTIPAWAAGAEPAGVPAQVAESRFVLLEGGRNFRDIGGYETADGRTVKSGVMYRSGSLGALTAQGQADLARLRAARIIDLRTSEERSHDTFDLQAAFGERYWTRDYDMSMGDAGALFADPSKLTGDAVRKMMDAGYRAMPGEQAPAYRAMFAELLAGKQPLVVNCTAGKDRTGIATALVLTALGVPYEAVKKDFLLSNGAPGMEALASAISPDLARLPEDLVAPLMGVEGGYLDTAFAQLRQDYGSIDAFLEKELGVGAQEKAVLRERMLD